MDGVKRGLRRRTIDFGEFHAGFLGSDPLYVLYIFFSISQSYVLVCKAQDWFHAGRLPVGMTRVS